MDYSDVRWWDESAGAEVAERLWSALEACAADDKNRHADLLHRVRMYGNRRFASLGSNYNRTTSKRRGRLNIVKDVCDTAINRLIGNRPKPTPLPISGSNWSIRRKARLLDRFLQGQFRVSRARQHMIQAVVDAVIAGDAFIKISEDGHQICLERTFSGDLSVPPMEARYGAPMTLYQHHFVDREVLKGMFPEKHDVIDEAERNSSDDEWNLLSVDARADQVEVVEGWRLPSTADAEDGRHVVAVKNGELGAKEWKHDYFPFVRLSWDAPYMGYWSDSMVDVVEGQQLEINRCVAKMARGNDISGHVVIFADQGLGSKFNRKKLTNEPLTVVPYTGQVPKLVTIEAISPKVREEIELLKAEARELAGVYQGGSEAVPRGLESAPAISRWNDLGAIRFRRFSEAFEQAHIDLAHQMIDRARDLAEKNEDFAVPAARDRYSLARVPWEEVDMKADQYVLAVYPTSSLPSDPAGKVAAVETLVKAGIIPPDRGAHLLDFPDLEGYLALDRAAYENIERQIETMIDEGKRQVPTPFTDLQLAMKLAQSHLLQAEMYEVPEDRLQLLRDYMTGIKALHDKRALEQQRLAMEAGAATGGTRSGGAGAPPAQGVAGVPPTAVGAGDVAGAA